MAKVRIIDEKVKGHLGQYLFQCSLATFVIFAILAFLDIITHTAIIATLGSSAFVVFTMPRTKSSEPRPLIGGYIMGILSGALCHLLSVSRMGVTLFPSQHTSYVVFGALAVGIAIFFMVVTNTEHPPAAGMALGLVLNKWDYLTILFILGAIIVMSVSKRMLKSVLMDLV